MAAFPRTSTFVSVLLVLVSLAIHAPVAPAQTLTLIADTTTAAPGGGTFSLFADARSIQGDKVAFYGIHASGSGIYTYQNGNLNVVADTTTTVPGTPDTFTTFFDVAVDRGFVVFTGGWPGPGGGCSFAGSEGVFARKFQGGAVREIVSSLGKPELCYHGVEFKQGIVTIGGGINPVDVIHNHSESILVTTTTRATNTVGTRRCVKGESHEN